MNYDAVDHQLVVKDVLRMGEFYFLHGLKRGLADIEKWAREFLLAFSSEVDFLSSLIKHPKFGGEGERRITTLLQTNEHLSLEFKQRRSLLARHLPITLTVNADGKELLPLSRVYVGPGASQDVSRISVGDLLMKHGYQAVTVEKSRVPYRVA